MCFQTTFEGAGNAFLGFDLTAESRALQVALTSIPEKYREVITLKMWGELTFAEIGDTLEISPNTAASRYRYGLEALRKSLAHEAESLRN